MESDARAFKSRLLAAQQKRKQASQDAQLLANRIALLKAEEEKAWKKIQKTRERATEIVKLRTDNEKRIKEREDTMASQAKQILEQRAAVLEANSNNRQDYLDIQQKKKVDEVRRLKEEKKRLRNDREIKRREEMEIAQRQKEMIHRKEEEIRLKKRQREEELKKRNREAYEQKLREQQNEIQLTESQVLALEKEEMELIMRLKSTQTIQKQAYDELETALAACSISNLSPMYSSRSSSNNNTPSRPALSSRGEVS